MLSTEEAQALLRQAQTADWQDHRLQAIGHDLSPDLRPIAYALLARTEDGAPLVMGSQESYQRRQEVINQGYARLAGLSPAERLTVFTAFIPAIATVVEAGWQLLARLPYQTGYLRKAFRLRDDGGVGSATAATRQAWLSALLDIAGPFRDKDVPWLAAWAPSIGGAHGYRGYASQPLGILCAATIDAGGARGQEVFDVLVGSARGEHPVGGMGRHVVTGLLAASRPDGWEQVERLLLAAQREEGLRQSILEAVDEAHPAAFRRVVRLILEHDLIRFSAVVRAAGVWFGFGWDVDSARAVRETLGSALGMLEDARTAREALSRGEAHDVYLALWALAFEDADIAVGASGPVLADAVPERRLAAAHLLTQLGLRAAREALVPLLDEPDLRVALCAFSGLHSHGKAPDVDAGDVFERLERLLARIGNKQAPLPSGVWPWLIFQPHAESVAGALVDNLGSRSPHQLIAHLPRMSPGDRLRVAERLAALPQWDAEVRDVLLGMLRDRSSWVRDRALALIAARPLREQDVRSLEDLLTRKSGDSRRGMLSLLLSQDDETAVASARRLLSARHGLQRLAGLDLLGQLARAGRAVEQGRDLARGYQVAHGADAAARAMTPEEETLIEAVLSSERDDRAAPTLDNALGLISPGDLTPPLAPRRRQLDPNTHAVRACLVSLHRLIEAHENTPVTVKTWQGSEDVLLGIVGYRFPQPDATLCAEDDAAANLPLAGLWHRWERERPDALRDPDGLELVRALLLLSGTAAAKAPDDPDVAISGGWIIPMAPTGAIGSDDAPLLPDAETMAADLALLAAFPADARRALSVGANAASSPHRLRRVLSHWDILSRVLHWLARLQRPASEVVVDMMLDGVETAAAMIPPQDLERELAAVTSGDNRMWRYGNPRHDVLNDGSTDLVGRYLQWHPDLWTDARHARYWGLLHWLDRPLPGLPRQLPPLERTLAAHRAGAATEADILEQLADPARQHHGGYWSRSDDLSTLSGRAPHPLMEGYPVLQRLVPVLRERILEVELSRGELPTAATPLALALRYSGGAAVFARLLAMLASTSLVRGYIYNDNGRAAVFSHLLRATYPAPGDTYEEFARQVDAARVEPSRLVAAAVYAPQWARLVERYLDWPHVEDAVWWMHAHTKESNWSLDGQLRETWQAQVAERTPLSAQDLLDGAVDVAWFWRSYRGVGPERWEAVYAAAKYASGGAGHARARLFADAMAGRVEGAEVVRRIAAKRNGDAVRALGLLPLPPHGATEEREAEVMRRYGAVQEFLRTGKSFGAQRRASEELAARIGLDNLARTAGYADPMRLQWAMEARTAADLRDGALTVADGDTSVTLALDAITADPRVMVVKAGGKTLKALPPRLKKNPAVVELIERKREVERQVSRMRGSLEGAMCRGDRFTETEVAQLLAHPVLARLLRNLVFVRDDAATGSANAGSVTVLGYPEAPHGGGGGDGVGNAALLFRACDGNLTPAGGDATNLRLAHPHDLLVDGRWHAWQHDCFASERIQPFKQVFRELYLPAGGERRHGDEARSGRYSGQQVQPSQALALLGARGWVARPEEGVSRTFHAEGLNAAVSFEQEFFTPAEVEGLTVDDVFFVRRGDGRPVPLGEVPPRVFSEVMRDLDLVVSVAHRGGVDPEATASTVEVRAAVARETCALLGLDNVELAGDAHALIAGALGRYSVHLGSAVVHRQPGGAVCIVPVHSQHRGRLFLPFVDSDPRTAEVVSKIVLLARDAEIKDPTILEQLR